MTDTARHPESADDKTDREEAISQIKAVYEEGVATINGIDYVFTITTHKKRLKVFSYFTPVQERLAAQDLSFMGTKEFDEVMGIIENIVTVEGSLISKKQRHWDERPEDFITFVTTALGVVSYPFLRGKI